MNYVRPGDNEYAPYYGTYVDKVADGDVFMLLASQIHETLGLLRALDDEQARFRYADNKWSIKEVVGHMVDTEKIFAYRALRAARGDNQPIPGFEQDDYVSNTNFDDRSLDSLLDELHHVRESTLLFFSSLSQDEQMRSVNASGVDFTARAILYIIAGHEKHHLDVLKEKYLPFV